MKKRLLLLASVAALAISLSGNLQASPLEHEMKSLGRSFKEVKEMVKTNTFNYDKISAIAKTSQVISKKCANLLPEEVEKLNGDAKKAATESYKKQIAEMDEAFGKLGDAASKKDDAAIKTAFDTLRHIMQEGHDDFRKDKD